MDMEKAKNLVKQIFNLQTVSEDTEHRTAVLSSHFFDNKINIDYFRDGTIYLSVDGGYGTYFDSADSVDYLRKKCVWFIAENMKCLYQKNQITSWGFNCNLCYISGLFLALNRE